MQNEIKRDIYMSFRVTQDEKEFITKKAKVAESSSTGAYIRKMAITGAIVKYENQDLKNLQKSLAGIQRNINQMAIRVNATSRMYDEDFDYLKEVMSGIWQSLESIQSVLYKSCTACKRYVELRRLFSEIL